MLRKINNSHLQHHNSSYELLWNSQTYITTDTNCGIFVPKKNPYEWCSFISSDENKIIVVTSYQIKIAIILIAFSLCSQIFVFFLFCFFYGCCCTSHFLPDLLKFLLSHEFSKQKKTIKIKLRNLKRKILNEKFKRNKANPNAY